jgi:hypothetical protein
MVKRVFDNHMVAHVWAQQTQSDGRSNNGQFYFSGSTIYSYGSHFPIARFTVDRHGNRCVLFTTQTYSVTTTAHCSRVRRAIPAGVPVYHVPHVMDQDQTRNGEAVAASAAAALETAKRARSSMAEWRLRSAADAHANANAFGKAFLGRNLSPLSAAELDSAIAEARAMQEAAEARQWAKRAAANAEKLILWRNGELAAEAGRELQRDCMLRVAGDRVETSWGAWFPVDAARRVYPLLAKAVAAGQALDNLRLELGQFVVDSISAEGIVRAGCHVVPWSEVKAAAVVLGLESETVAA